MNILVILGGGGHTAQMIKLVNMLGPEYGYSYLMLVDDQTSEQKIKLAGPVYRAHLPRQKRPTLFSTLAGCLLCTVQEFRVLLRARPKVILSAGAGIAVPACIIGRLLGAKIIHVESASRVNKLSATGRIMYRVAHLFFVQWESLTEKYPKAIYAGRLL